MAEDALATEQRRQESAERNAVTAENALAAEQRRQELAKRAAETAEKRWPWSNTTKSWPNALRQRQRKH
jgi:hypothetical protein